jgi:hypothetical protein
MQQKFQLKITKPCSESLDNMSAHPQGYYCHSCEKKVVDFTEKLPSEIAQFFTEHRHERVCGRFQKHQLETDYAYLDTNRKMPSMKYAAGFLVSMLLSEQIAAENLALKPLTEQIKDNNQNPKALNIKGQVIAEATGKGVSAKISVSKGMTVCYTGATDANGFFDFSIKEQEGGKMYITVFNENHQFPHSVLPLEQFMGNPARQIKVKVKSAPAAQVVKTETAHPYESEGDIMGDVMPSFPPPPPPAPTPRKKN